MKTAQEKNYAILFIDDEEKSGKYFKKYLNPEYKVYNATRAKEALEILKDKFHEIAIVISDQRMPEMTGVEIMNIIKVSNPSITRILTTAYSDIKESIRAINEGNIFGYINKPWNIEELKDIIHKGFCEYKANITTLSLSGSIVHEMRNSINKINLILYDIKDLLDQDQNKTFSIQDIKSKTFDCLNAVKSTNQIINLTLKNVRGSSDEQNIEISCINNIINQALEEYPYDNKSQKQIIEIKNEADKFDICSDRYSIIYTIFNLLKNSLYFLDKYPEMKITISYKKGLTSDQFNYVYFKDTAKGIKTRYKSNI